jgi:hypothetical protein
LEYISSLKTHVADLKEPFFEMRLRYAPEDPEDTGDQATDPTESAPIPVVSIVNQPCPNEPRTSVVKTEMNEAGQHSGSDAATGEDEQALFNSMFVQDEVTEPDVKPPLFSEASVSQVEQPITLQRQILESEVRKCPFWILSCLTMIFPFLGEGTGETSRSSA